jgi:large subunit ribosomal protein L29
MKTVELKDKLKGTLQKLCQEKKEKLRRLRFESSQGRIKDITEINKTKKDIARILTILNQKPKQE